MNNNQEINQDNDHLKLLSIFYYVVAGLEAMFAFFPLIHFFVGLFMVLAPEKLSTSGNEPPEFIGWFFIIFASVIIVFGLFMAALTALTGYYLSKRKYYLFCLVMAGIECVFFPFGTVLGVFALIVLMRDSVKDQFSKRKFNSTQSSIIQGIPHNDS